MDKPVEEKERIPHIYSVSSDILANILSQVDLRAKLTFQMSSKELFTRIDPAKFELHSGIYRKHLNWITRPPKDDPESLSEFAHAIYTQDYDLVKFLITRVEVEEEHVMLALNIGNSDIFKLVYKYFIDLAAHIQSAHEFLRDIYEKAHTRAEELYDQGPGYKKIYAYLLDDGRRFLIISIIKYTLHHRAFNFIVDLLVRYRDYTKYMSNADEVYYRFLDKLFTDLLNIVVFRNEDLLVNLVEAMNNLGYYNIKGTFKLGIVHLLPKLVSLVIDKLNGDDIKRGLRDLIELLPGFMGKRRETKVRPEYNEIANILVNQLVSLGDVTHEDWLNILKLGALAHDMNILNAALEHEYTPEEIYSAYKLIPRNYTPQNVESAKVLLQALPEEIYELEQEIKSGVQDVTKMLIKLNYQGGFDFAKYAVERNIITPNYLLLLGVHTKYPEMVSWALRNGADNIDEAYKLAVKTGIESTIIGEALLDTGKIKDVNFVLTTGVEQLNPDIVKWALIHGANNIDRNVCYLYMYRRNSSAIITPLLQPLFNTYVSSWECALGLAAFIPDVELFKSILNERKISNADLEKIYHDILEYIEEYKLMSDDPSRFDSAEGQQILQIIRQQLYGK